MNQRFNISSNIYLKQMELGPMQNFVYFVGDPKTREVLVVDPAWDVTTIIKTALAEDLKIVGALITHTHFDHVNGTEELLKNLDCPVYVHDAEKNEIPAAKSAIRPTRNGQIVKVGGVEIELVHTPGHTPG